MRIIGGILRGKKILNPTDKSTRPLKDMVKESIFNIIEHSKNQYVELNNAKVLDLFSGTGSFGIECLSRNVNKVTFVENNENAFNILSKNINKLKVSNKANIVVKTVTDYLSDFSEKDNKFDLIFLDPPFKDQNIYELFKLIKEKNLLKNKGLIILHRHKKSEDKFPENFEIVDKNQYGLSKILYFF